MTDLKRKSEFQWWIEPFGKMRVPAIIYADEQIIKGIDEKVLSQVINVAKLPGIVSASYAMPDAHWGYGFCIGGVAAFDAEQGGVISAGGVGFDISCGVRTLRTGLDVADIEANRRSLADALASGIPAGLGSMGRLKLSPAQIDELLTGGAAWAVDQGYGTADDLAHSEEEGRIDGAEPRYVSDQARNRQKNQMGTLGSGNHYLEIQKVTQLFDEQKAAVFGIKQSDVLVSIHCGSRGLGHQIATDYLPLMVKTAAEAGIELGEKELACAPIKSAVGSKYLGAMNCGINCAMANRQVLTHLVREVFDRILPKAQITQLYDVSHNTCKREEHRTPTGTRQLYVHRKGATRSFPPGHECIPADLRSAGQPVLIGGTMGTASYILAGTEEAMSLSWGSACHGAGRTMSRRGARKNWQGRQVVDTLGARNITIRSASYKGIAEEAPQAYKDVTAVVNATANAGLAAKVAKLEPMICIKG